MRPFPILPGKYYLLTRDVARREHRLKPTPEHCALFLFLAFFYAQRYGIKIYGLTLMSTHYHMVVCDPQGRLPDFVRDFHSRVAHFFNLLHKRRGAFWEPADRVGRCRLEDADAVLRKLIYTALNPTQDGVTHNSQLWAGVLISPRDIGEKFTIECPQIIREQGLNYEPVSHTIERPSCYRELSNAKAKADFSGRARIQQDLICRNRNKPFLGVEKAMATPIETQSPPHEPSINPKFATRNQTLLVATLKAYGEWCGEHQRTLEKFVNGHRDIVWPPGTWAKHRLYGCPRT